MSSAIAPELTELVDREVRWIARRLGRRGAVEFDDLVAYGHLGLVEAQRGFDPRRGVSFEVYARYRIRGAIFDGLREAGCFSRRAFASIRRQALAHFTVGAPGGDRPTPEEDAYQVTQAIVDLATAFLVDASKAVHRNAPDPERANIDRDALESMRGALAHLGPADREVITATYDLEDRRDSGAKLAERLGVSRSTISRRHRRILARLRRLTGQDPE